MTWTNQDHMDRPYNITNWSAYIIGLQTGKRSSEVTCRHERHNLSAMNHTKQASKQCILLLYKIFTYINVTYPNGSFFV